MININYYMNCGNLGKMKRKEDSKDYEKDYIKGYYSLSTIFNF